MNINKHYSKCSVWQLQTTVCNKKMWNTQFTIHIVECAVFNTQCAIHTVQYTVWQLHYTECNTSVAAAIHTVSVLGKDEGYTVKYNPLPEGVPEGEARGNS